MLLSIYKMLAAEIFALLLDAYLVNNFGTIPDLSIDNILMKDDKFM